MSLENSFDHIRKFWLEAIDYNWKRLNGATGDKDIKRTKGQIDSVAHRETSHVGENIH